MAFYPDQHFRAFDFRSCKHLLVAVSGGSDSAGLLCGLHAYLNTLDVRPRLSAVTVDHALRDGSLAEAQGVAALCAQLNIAHTIKQWQGAKPSSGIQAAARKERRALLCQTASEIGADVICTGHTQDDQIETVVMRQRRGSGPGLAGIAEASLGYDDRGDGRPVWMWRPLVGVSRQDIRDYLQREAISWADDPSNDNEVYERVAVRKELSGLNEGKHREILALQARAATARQRLAQEAAVLMAQHVREVTPGLIHIEGRAFANANSSALPVLLRTLIAFAGGAATLGDGAICETIIAKAAAHCQGTGAKPWRTTSNGALIELRQGGVYLLREARARKSSHVEFDGRYRATARAHSVALPHSLSPDVAAPASLVRRAMELEPLFSVDETTQLPAFEAARSGCALRRLINPWPDLVPLFDLALAKGLSALASAQVIPEISIYSAVKN
ncbi:MAG: tRNA lysidine(34) synthetase TilS [Rhizobiaceae bacterium]